MYREQGWGALKRSDLLEVVEIAELGCCHKPNSRGFANIVQIPEVGCSHDLVK